MKNKFTLRYDKRAYGENWMPYCTRNKKYFKLIGDLEMSQEDWEFLTTFENIKDAYEYSSDLTKEFPIKILDYEK